MTQVNLAEDRHPLERQPRLHAAVEPSLAMSAPGGHNRFMHFLSTSGTFDVARRLGEECRSWHEGGGRPSQTSAAPGENRS
jgi:hypothetical protein